MGCDAITFRPAVIPDWIETLPTLKVEDICGLSETLMSGSEGRRRSPWIWTTHMGVMADGTDAGDDGMYASNHPIAKLTMHRSSKGRNEPISSTSNAACGRGGTPA